MSKQIDKNVVWSKGRTKAEMAKQTSWSSSKDWSGLSGFRVYGYDFMDYVSLTAITSHGVSHNKYFQIPVDKIDEVCDALMHAKKIMHTKKQ
jgi:hypothetical protein